MIQILLGIFGISLGIALICLRQPFTRLVHYGLKRMYGEAFVRLTVTKRRGNIWGILVGVMLIATGLYFVGDAL